MSIDKAYSGWAINLNSDEGHGLIGRFWWFGGFPAIPDQLRGHRTCVFETRHEARKALISVRKAFPKARVERVRVDISVIGKG